MQDLSSSVSAGFNNQREENNRLYTAIGTLSDKVSASLQSLQAALAERSKVSGSFVLMLIATGLSLVAIIGGVVHFYVSDQVRNVKEETERLANQQAQIRTDNQAAHADFMSKLTSTANTLTDERIRSIKVDAEREAEARLLRELKRDGASQP